VNPSIDQYHYLHHKKFECNYGTSGEPFDHLFGTYRGSLDPNDESYKGGADEAELAAESKFNNADADQVKGSIEGQGEGAKYVPKRSGIWAGEGALSLRAAVPTLEHGMFHAHYLAAMLLFYLAAGGDARVTKFNHFSRWVGGALAFGPMIFGYMLIVASRDKKSIIWPFHTDSKFAIGLHVIVGFVIGVLPVYVLAECVLRPPAGLTADGLCYRMLF